MDSVSQEVLKLPSEDSYAALNCKVLCARGYCFGYLPLSTIKSKGQKILNKLSQPAKRKRKFASIL